jgi:hypothetical protein
MAKSVRFADEVDNEKPTPEEPIPKEIHWGRADMHLVSVYMVDDCLMMVG